MIKEMIKKNPNYKIILGILWGVAVGLLFRSACYGRKCVIVNAPKESDVTSKVYSSGEKDGKCYRLVSTDSQCTDNTIDE
jgi:hypothetical protein